MLTKCYLPCAVLFSKLGKCANMLFLHENPLEMGAGILIFFILQIRKLKYKGGK